MPLLPPGVKVHLAFGFIDMRKGIDRLVHNAHRIDLTGDSLRRTRERPAKKD